MRNSVLWTSLAFAIASVVVCLLAQSIPSFQAGGGIVWVPDDPYYWFERIGFPSGVVGVYLMVKRSWVNFPVGLIWAVAYAFYFYAVARHYGEMSLSIINAIYLIDGWIKWKSGTVAVDLPITRLSGWNWVIILMTIAVAYPLFVLVLHSVRGQYVYADGATTALSLAAQYLTNRKKIESWYFWIVANMVIVPVFFYREFYATAILISIFTVMAFFGLAEWRQAMRLQTSAETASG